MLVTNHKIKNRIFVVFKPLQIKCQFIHGSQISWYQKLEYLKKTSVLPNVFNKNFITERSMYGVHLTKDEIQTHKLRRWKALTAEVKNPTTKQCCDNSVTLQWSCPCVFCVNWEDLNRVWIENQELFKLIFWLNYDY